MNKNGNPNLKKGCKPLPGAGRPKGAFNTNTTLRKAVEAYEKETGRIFVKHYIEQAFKDKRTACDLASRLYPALKSIEGNLALTHKILNLIGLNPIVPKKETKKGFDSGRTDNKPE